MKIGIDVDGVLINSMVTFAEIYNEMYIGSEGFKPKTKNDVTHWDFYKDWNISEGTLWFIFDQVRERMQTVPFIDKLASKYLRKLNKKNHLDIITGMKDGMEDIVETKLRKHNVIRGIHFENILIVGRNKNNKMDYGYDIYCDDNPEFVEKFKDQPNKRLLLYDQPWNQHIDCSKLHNVIRVHSWKEVWQKMRILL